MATMVLSNVGAAELFAIFSTSARFSAIADSMAGLKNSTFTRSKRGTPPKGPFHSARSGLGSEGSAAILAALAFGFIWDMSTSASASNSTRKPTDEIRIVLLPLRLRFFGDELD